MLSSGLSMLWESDDAELALRERFGLDGREGAACWLGEVLAGHWGLVLRALPRLTVV